MKDIKELRDEQILVYEQLKQGKIGQSQAKELANVAGKIMGSAKLQMEYNKLVGSKDSPIKFLQVDEN